MSGKINRMYSAEIEQELRQGDIINGVHLLGAIKLGSIQVTNNQQGEAVSW